MQQISFDESPIPEDFLQNLAVYAKRRTADKYMSGELFNDLHGRLSDLLGMEAALYVPSGKMGQMIALKIHTSRVDCSRIALHPRSHMEEYEARAYHELWGLSAIQLGAYDRLPTADDLAEIKEKLGAVVLELPMRKLGCLLPTWDELCAFSALARERQIPLHLDGARLWESQPFYDRPFSEITSLFDSVYVSFDKGLGCLAGGALLGRPEFIDEAKIWQRRAGGRALRSFPYLLSALQGMDERLPMMKSFHAKAEALAVKFGQIEGVSVSPPVPHANAFYVSFKGNRNKAKAARDKCCEEFGLRLFEESIDCVDISMVRFEVTIRGAGLNVDEELALATLKQFKVLCSD